LGAGGVLILALSCNADDLADRPDDEGGIAKDADPRLDARPSDDGERRADVAGDRPLVGDSSATGGAAGAGRGGAGGSAGMGTGGSGATGGAGSGGSAGKGGGGASGATGSGGSAGIGGSGGSAGAAGKAGSGGSAGMGGSAGRDGGAAGNGGSKDAGSVGDGGIFNQCRFHFGTIDSRVRGNAAFSPHIDFFTPGWVGQSDTFDMDYACAAARELPGATLAVVSYIIAFSARRDQGLQDCNVSGQTNLCRYGATYIRNRLEDRIIPQYAMYARGFAGSCGTTRPIIWLMEPDYYQYHAGGDANALTPQEAAQIMGRLVATVRQHLPNAIFSLDISPWIPNEGADWYAHFNLADFTFINTSGGGTDANNARIRAVNTMTWAGVHRVTGKPIIADTGYGASGAPTGHDAQWDVAANINARIADGVVGINQYNPSSSWPSTLSQIRPQLGKVACF
jgi:hypothetical protein